MKDTFVNPEKIDDKAVQPILVQLAAAAANTNLTTSGPELPKTWKELTSKSVFALTVGNVQFLLAYGNVGNDVIACLSIGLPWQNFLGAYSNGFQTSAMQQLPEDVAGKTTSDQTIMSIYIAAYQFLRGPIWEALSFLNDPGAKGKPLYITGMGLGSALAQIVALDFRSGNKGPNQQLFPQSTQPPSYVFSSVNFSSTAFQKYYEDKITQTFNTAAGSAALPVDQFPDQPSASANFAPLGEQRLVAASIPAPYYTPWEVRDSNFYIKTLGGTPVVSPPSKTFIPNPPAGFSQSLAFSLGEYVALTYKQALEPGTPAPVNAQKIFNYGGHNAIAAIFTTANSLIVTFRGSITFEEFLTMDANSATALNPAGQQITSGTYDVLYKKLEDGKEQTLTEQIKEELKKLNSKNPLYITGHGFGGALANLFAMELAFNTDPAVDVGVIYTFGANYFAGANTANDFSKKLKAVSYQILRPKDVVATALQSFRYWFPVENTVSLNGALDILEDTNHALSSYLKLLDPARIQPS